MKVTLKIMSVFLSFVLLVSGLSIGFMGSAADYSWQLFIGDVTGERGEYTRKLTNYKVEKASEGWNDDANFLSYENAVYAKDNADGYISDAAKKLYSKIDDIISYEYGVGNYNLELVYKSICQTLEAQLSDPDREIRVGTNGERYVPVHRVVPREKDVYLDYNDRYQLRAACVSETNERNCSYSTLNWDSSNWDIVAVDENGYIYTKEQTGSAIITATSVDTNKMCKMWVHVEHEPDTPVATPWENVPDAPVHHMKEHEYDADGKIVARGFAPTLYETEYEYYNIESIVSYMLGTAKAITSANWFNTFKFVIDTDFETALLADIGETGSLIMIPDDYEVIIKNETYTWNSHARTYDKSGTVARYHIPESYDYRYTESVDDQTISKLKNLSNFFTDDVLMQDFSTWTNAQCVNYVKNNHIDELFAPILDFSNDFILRVFGNKIFAITAALNQMRPNYLHDQALENGNLNANYYGWRIVRQNPTQGPATFINNVADMDKVVRNIDQLITNNDLGTILNLFLKPGEGFLNAPGLAGLTYYNASELIMMLLRNFLYQDSLINLVAGKILPLLGNLLYTGPNPVVGLASPSLADIAEALYDMGIYLKSPQDFINLSWTAATRAQFPEAAAYFLSIQATEGKSTWDVVAETIDDCKWYINGDKDKFVDAICAALAPAAYLLTGIFCSSYGQSNPYIMGTITAALIVNGHIHIYYADAYRWLLLPLLEALGMTSAHGLMTSNQYAANSSVPYPDDHGVEQTRMSENKPLRNVLNPILNWVETDVASKPIETILAILPNLSRLLTSGKLKEMLGLRIKLDIKIAGVSWIGAFKGLLEDYTGPWDDDKIVLWNALQANDIKIRGYHICDVLDPTRTLTITTAGGSKSIKSGSINALFAVLLGDTFKAKIPTGEYDEFGYPIYEPDYSNPVLDENGDPVYDDEGNPLYHDREIAIPLPTLCDQKLQECGVIINYNNTNGDPAVRVRCDNPGKVLVFLLRYIFYGINYTEPGSAWTNPPLLSAFIDPAQLEGELFMGISIKSLILQIVLHPEAAICALVELFSPNTNGYPAFHPEVLYNYYEEAYPYYLNNEVLGKPHFGAPVRYTQYWTRENATEVSKGLFPLIENVLDMLKLDVSFELLGKQYTLNNGIEALIKDIINGVVYSNDVLSIVAGGLYGLIGQYSESFGLDTILDAALDIRFDTDAILGTVHYKVVTERCDQLGITDSNIRLNTRSEFEQNLVNEINEAAPEKVKFDDSLFYKMEQQVDEEGNPVYETDPETGDPILDENGDPIPVMVSTGEPLDWGLEDTVAFIGPDSVLKYTREELFTANLIAILAPAAELVRILFYGKDLCLLDLLTIQTFEIYHYAITPLIEALGVPSNKIKYITTAATRSADTTPIPDTEHPIGGGEFESVPMGNLYAIEDLITPIVGLLNVISANPLDWILSTIPNFMYYLLSGAFNDSVNELLHFAYVILDVIRPIIDGYDLIETLLATLDLDDYGISLSLPLDLDINGIVNSLLSSYMFGQVLTFELAGAPLTITLPNLDLSMLCTGVPKAKMSASQNQIVVLSNGSGADLITVMLQYVLDTLFMYNNWMNVADWLTISQNLDAFDSETAHMLLSDMNIKANEGEAPDKVLGLMYKLLSMLTKVSGPLSQRFRQVDFGLLDMFQGDFQSFFDRIMTLLNPTGEETAVTGFFAKLKAFFQKIILFFKSLFGGLGG